MIIKQGIGSKWIWNVVLRLVLLLEKVVVIEILKLLPAIIVILLIVIMMSWSWNMCKTVQMAHNQVLRLLLANLLIHIEKWSRVGSIYSSLVMFAGNLVKLDLIVITVNKIDLRLLITQLLLFVLFLLF